MKIRSCRLRRVFRSRRAADFDVRKTAAAYLRLYAEARNRAQGK
ncbi:MAG: hypothetical protein ACI4QO_02165 [Clostridia bacterium]